MGKIRFSKDMIEAATNTGTFYHYLSVFTVLQRFLTVDIMHYQDYSIYVGCHPDFDILKQGEEIPWYNAEITIVSPEKGQVVGKSVLKITRTK